MSSIVNLILGSVDRILGDGNIKSDQQGLFMIVIDRILKVVTDVLNS